MAIRVNGDLLDEEEIADEARAMLPRLAQAMPEEPSGALRAKAREWAQENAIERALLRQGASAAGETVEQFTARLTAKLQPPKPSDLSAYYRKNQEQFVASERVRAAH